MIDATTVAEIREIRHRMFERRLHALIAGVILLVVALTLGVIIAIDPGLVARAGHRRSMAAMDGLVANAVLDPRCQRRQRDWLGQSDAAAAAARIGGARVASPLVAARRVRRCRDHVRAVHRSREGARRSTTPAQSADRQPAAPSFPSGHAIAGAVTAFGLVVVLLPASPRRWVAIGFASAFAGLMAISRTSLAAHWLTDTIAGACIGTGLALVWPAALELARERHSRQRLGDVVGNHQRTSDAK